MTGDRVDLTECHERLEWCRILASRVHRLVSDLEDRTRRAGVVHEILGSDGYRWVRFSLARPSDIPRELTFQIADFVVNARGCLDMAVQRVVELRGGTNAKGKHWKGPQFPITLGQQKDRHLRAARDHLPIQHVEAMEGLQVKRGPWGWDLFTSGALLHELANEVKHRNLAVVRHAPSIVSRVQPAESDGVEVVTGPSPFDRAPGHLMTLRAPSGVDDGVLLARPPDAWLATSVVLPPCTHWPTGWRLPVTDLLSQSLAFVQLALTRMQEADDAYASGVAPEFTEALLP